jgi:hypothetical protein
VVKKFGNYYRDRIPHRVRKVYEVSLSGEISRVAELGKRKGGNNVGSFEQLRMVADLAELHDEVHE